MLAVVDMGSNSFRLEVGRVEGEQILRLDTVRETLRIGAGIDERGRLTPAAQRAALACLARFGERLRGFHPASVRAVATQTFRAAANAATFLPKAEAALGFPIDIIAGHEEARLIWLGVAHVLPASDSARLVVDIGGGSTEFVIGRGMEAERLESLKLGCVDMTRRFFAHGELGAAAFRAAETHARAEIEAIGRDFGRAHWSEAYASSGTSLALAEILESNALSPQGITREGLVRLRKAMIAAGSVDGLSLSGLKPTRAPVLAGGLAIMMAAIEELAIARIDPVGGALRLGVLYDLLGRRAHRDSRALTVERFLQRHRIDRDHAKRVAATARMLYGRATPHASQESAQRVEWAGLLHEIGTIVSHIAFHKHGAYVLQHSDMPGFSAGDQERLALLVLACRGALDKVGDALRERDVRAQILALRLAVLLHHARRPLELPRLDARIDRSVQVTLPQRWLAAHPQTRHLLEKEAEHWNAAGYRFTRSR
jgi:exopolyphosphatase/guanosine-5'-triphosphate,3'-diphosphate pyrophosphatase